MGKATYFEPGKIQRKSIKIITQELDIANKAISNLLVY